MNLDELAPLKFYQNLGRRQDRRGEVEFHFFERGIEVERFPAINARYLKSECRYERKSARALAMTSRATLREAQRRGADAVVVFEDDVVLAEDWRERLAEIDLPEDWGLLYLGCAHQLPPTPVSKGLVRVTKAVDMHAWVVNAKYWLAIRKRFQARTLPLPESVHQDQLLMQMQQEIPTYAIWPNVAWQRVSYSDNWGKTFSNYGDDGRQLWHPEGLVGVNQAMARLEYNKTQKLVTSAEQEYSKACFWREKRHFGVLANSVGLLGTGVCLAKDSTILDLWAGKSLLKPTTEEATPVAWHGAEHGTYEVIWLDGTMDYRTTTERLEEAWAKLCQGGLLGGGDFANEFNGEPRGDFQWKASQKALKHWAAGKGLMPIYNKGNRDWVLFKNQKPAPSEILVYSVCTSGVAYAAETTENHMAFCKNKGYEYAACGDEVFPKTAEGKLVRHPAWARFLALQQLMESRPHIRWFFYLDIDAIFHNWSYHLENFCLPAFDCICPTWEDHDGPRPSLATMLWQNTPTARKFIQAIWEMPLERCTRSNEEDAIKHVLADQPEFRNRLFGVPQRLLNAVPSHGNDWNGDDFILHFPSVGEPRANLLRDALAFVDRGSGAEVVPQARLPHTNRP